MNMIALLEKLVHVHGCVNVSVLEALNTEYDWHLKALS